MSAGSHEPPGRLQSARLEVALDAFTSEALSAECERLGVSPEELVTFAISYYLADVDSGRVARHIAGPRGTS